MPLQRYAPVDHHAEPPREDNEGEFLKYDDLVALLDTISRYDPDMSPRSVVLKAIFEEVVG